MLYILYHRPMFWHRLTTSARLFFLSLLFILVVSPEWPTFQTERFQLNTLIGLRQFDFVVWEGNALLTKTEAFLAGGHTYLDEATGKQLVLDYLALIGEVRTLEGQISAIYANPDIADPAVAAVDLQQEVTEKRARLAELQPLAEAVMQEQVTAVLLDEGLGRLGQVWPPVQMHMTPLPLVLIVSPRDRVEQIYNIPLTPGLSVPDQEELEAAVTNTIDRSALVVPIGGLGIFPSMVIETSSVNFLADVTAHEWMHHWLSFYPLGINYAASPELRTINETVASIVGTEVGEKVIARFYPEYVPPPPPPPSTNPPPSPDPNQPPPFNFRAEMAETRVTADRLLAEGQIKAAEFYMEARRRYFVANGYNIRKLNQAYFAFYGAYADTPGATGSDPIGPTLTTLRAQSPSLRAFMDQVAPVTSLEELRALVAQP
jgi:hypothetical protein